MAKRYGRRRALVVSGLLLWGVGGAAVGQDLSEQAQRQIQAIYADKAAWTPAQMKLDTSLLYAGRESRGLAMVQGMRTDQDLALLRRVANRAGVQSGGMVVVDIRADVTDDLLQAIADLGGRVASAYPAFGAVRARVPIRQVEALADLPEVRRISPRQDFRLYTGTQTSQGDVAHAVASARTAHGIDGTGVKVGVLSDGVDSLAARQATHDLPPTCPQTGACVQVVSGQAGSGDEGTAMLEIVHDLAPGAQLYFATAFNGVASFAANILTLKNTYGCDIIVDDVGYFDEGAFQDDVIAQAVNTVTAGGALHFSSAGNSGRYDAAASGTWEGDFVPTCWALGGSPAHSFDGQTCPASPPSDPLTASTSVITLKWSDPLGGSANDYDLFRFDSTVSTILSFSAMTQNGNDDPYERVNGANSGDRIVVTKYKGATRALRVDTNGGLLDIATARAIYGHNGGESTISVAAADVASAGAGAFTGGAANPVEYYSSDGPRRMFYNPNGTAITSGKVTFASGGGRDLQKPDITAADDVTTTTPGFIPFRGTSAAAPHAAAIAALLKSAANNPSTSQALAAMFATALDVDPAGRDRNAGRGIVMAGAAADALISVPSGDFYTLPPCRVFDTRLAGAQTTGVPLTCGTTYDFTIVGGTCGVPSGAKAISLNATVTAPTAQGSVLLFASGGPVPLTATLNYVKGLTVANNAVASLSAGGKMSVRCTGSGTSHVIVDVNGYFQ
jgi:hypothetical protein